MFILGAEKRRRRYYAGLIEWLEVNIGDDGTEWIAHTRPVGNESDRLFLYSIEFINPADEVLTRLRWI